MFFKSVDLTTALRPSLQQDELLLCVQDAVGLYEGKYKIPHYQNGHAYLTSHRICYVGAADPRMYSVAIDLKDVERTEYQASFLRSSPKITLYPKPVRKQLLGRRAGVGHPVSPTDPRKSESSAQSHVERLSRLASGTWVCPICSFSNPVPSNFDAATANASTPLPPCLACGIKPPLTIILKAAIASATNRGVTSSPAPTQQTPSNGSLPYFRNGDDVVSYSATKSQKITCPRCTFANHPSLLECEICGASLKTVGNGTPDRSDSPAPLFNTSQLKNVEITDSMKLSFRGGGEKVFHERLNGALIQRKWLLQNAPPAPKVAHSVTAESTRASLNEIDLGSERTQGPKGVGIAGLERRGFQTRKNNEAVIGNAFEDLEALMASAKEIVALAESLASDARIKSSDPSIEANAVISQSAAALGMVTTRDMLGSSSTSENLYLSELSRNLAEYLTDDREGVLRREGGIMSLIDLWSIFNRRRNGVELVSPSDFHKAAELWEKLKLPVRLRRFRSGLLVVQPHDWTDERCVWLIESWFNDLEKHPPASEVPWDWSIFGRGVTAQEAAQRFGWSVGVASEELEMAEDRGILCREEGIEGTRFWWNHILNSRFEDKALPGNAVNILPT